MLMAFVGDVHGRVLHAIAALAGRQKATRRPFDLIVQVGDLGAYPEVTRMDAATLRYLEADPTRRPISVGCSGVTAAARTTCGASGESSPPPSTSSVATTRTSHGWRPYRSRSGPTPRRPLRLEHELRVGLRHP